MEGIEKGVQVLEDQECDRGNVLRRKHEEEESKRTVFVKEPK